MKGAAVNEFRSDTERRVLGHLRAPHDQDGAPFSDEQIAARVAADPHTGIGAGAVVATLEQLRERGLCDRERGGWVMTADGFEALTG